MIYQGFNIHCKPEKEITRCSLRDAVKALLDRYHANNCKIDGDTDDIFLVDDLIVALREENK